MNINLLKSARIYVQCRQLHGRIIAPSPPAARGKCPIIISTRSIGFLGLNLGRYQSPNEFLAAIGRSSDTKLKVETWDDLWRMRGEDMKKAGLAVAERRYILWSLEKYRQGHDPAAIAIKERPKKTIRGWGPRVQNGKRVR
ncbi:hypothetical protein BDV93DRAFT_444370 [Ceratobasidium sp. AG-I]|nr:hypothetical protein BDV93DRAFT_444370 [Ceratobasidium sp. AG-I]